MHQISVNFVNISLQNRVPFSVNCSAGGSSFLVAQSAGAAEYADSCYKCPGYDTKQSDGEVPVMLEFWGMQSTPSLPSLPSPPWPGG